MNINIKSLNAPYGARCFLTQARTATAWPSTTSLNAPYGARCFLTPKAVRESVYDKRLNAPYGARCILTELHS